jgi:ABC-2 type transport system ATP-binding protein
MAWEWLVSETPIIETEQLTRRFGSTVAVHQLDLQVQPGAILGLVGPDGAGKTTTIRLLAAIMNPSEGHVRVFGYDTMTRPEPIKRRIGYMAQRFNLYGDLSVRENLDFFADVFEVTGEERRRRLQQLLSFSRLTRFQDRRAAHLSGGMQKKLALACTLIHTPEIILLDEPTTGVDPVSRREFWEILTQLHLDGVTLVLSTPYMDEAERCSQVGLMYQGRLLLCDSPEHIKQRVPLELVILRPSDMRAAHAVLSQDAQAEEVQVYGDQLRILVPDAQQAIPRIRALLAERSVRLLEIRPARPRMEEAFISLVRLQAPHRASDENTGQQDTSGGKP